MSSRRNLFIRSVAAFAGDFAVGFSLAAACIWVIQSAALGLFLSILLWLLAAIAALAMSQYLVHPAVALLLSDRKLDDGIAAVSSLAQGLAQFASGFSSPAVDHLRGAFTRYAADCAR